MPAVDYSHQSLEPKIVNFLRLIHLDMNSSATSWPCVKWDLMASEIDFLL